MLQHGQLHPWRWSSWLPILLQGLRSGSDNTPHLGMPHSSAAVHATLAHVQPAVRQEDI